MSLTGHSRHFKRAGSTSLLHRAFTNVNSERSTSLHDDAPAVDGLGGGDDAAAANVADVDGDG
jgi:hypothetical protein